MHASRWPWLTLIACAAASGPAGAQGQPPSDAGAAPSDTGFLQPAAPPAGGEAAEGTGSGEWTVPPMRVYGSLAYDGRAGHNAGEATATSHLLTANIGGNTYLYQPWVALVAGSVGLTSSWATGSGAGQSFVVFGDTLANDKGVRQEQFLTGTGRVDLFPRSRFPFEMHFERQDSRTDAGLNSSINFQRSNYGFSQRYRPENGSYNLVGLYDHRDQTGLGFRAKQDSFSTDLNTNWKANYLTLGASYNRAHSEGLVDDSRFTTLVGNHTYTPSSALSVNTTANLTRTQELGVAHTDLQVLQLSSVSLYHKLDSPLTLTGTFRGLMLREHELDTVADSIGGTLGANYDVNSNLRLTGTVGLNINRTGSGDSNLLSGSAGAIYQGDMIEFSGFQYNWFTSGNLGISATNGVTENDREQAAIVQVGHNISRPWRISPQSVFSLTAGQTLSGARVNSTREQLIRGPLESINTLLNTVSGTFQNTGDGRTAYARASLSDSSEIGGGNAHFQLLNFQLSGNFEFGYGRSLTGDLTYQRTNQRPSDLRNDPLLAADPVVQTRSSGAAGEITFRQNQVMGIPRLRFLSRVRLAQDVLKQPGQLLSIPDRETRLWENRLDWNIGRLETALELRLSRIDGRRIDSLWFRVQRNFGG